MGDWLFAWENEDGDLMVEVEMEPDRDTAGQRLADEHRSVVTFEGRFEIKTQDCECIPTHDAKGDCGHGGHECFDHPGEACIVREGVDVWCFTDHGEPGDYTERDIAYRLTDEPQLPIYRPTVKVVPDPNQLTTFPSDSPAEPDRG